MSSTRDEFLKTCAISVLSKIAHYYIKRVPRDKIFQSWRIYRTQIFILNYYSLFITSLCERRLPFRFRAHKTIGFLWFPSSRLKRSTERPFCSYYKAPRASSIVKRKPLSANFQWRGSNRLILFQTPVRLEILVYIWRRLLVFEFSFFFNIKGLLLPLIYKM